MEDWMRNCESLVGEDADGEPCPLLTEWEEDTSSRSLLGRLEAFLDETAPGPALIDEVKGHLMDVMKNTVGKIVATWSASTVEADAQRSLHKHMYLMIDKVRFLHRIFSEILQRASWQRLHRSLYVAVNDILLAAIPVARQYPHNPSDFMQTLLSFQIRPFLCNFCLAAWDGYGSSFDAPKLITKLPAELIVPTMRRLGMMDVLDKDWNMHGSWKEILSEISRCEDVPIVSKDYSDTVLEEKSLVWRNARNSIDCRGLSKRSVGRLGFMPPAVQCFEYFSKCSVKECSNIETPEKPHEIRCTRCYYFHFCSPACERYAEAFDLHDCDFTPREKAADIKGAMEAYLGSGKKSGSNENKHERCNFCKTKRENVPREVLMQCRRCKSVAYCDRSCQEWDWPEHKLGCKKK